MVEHRTLLSVLLPLERSLTIDTITSTPIVWMLLDGMALGADVGIKLQRTDDDDDRASEKMQHGTVGCGQDHAVYDRTTHSRSNSYRYRIACYADSGEGQHCPGSRFGHR